MTRFTAACGIGLLALGAAVYGQVTPAVARPPRAETQPAPAARVAGAGTQTAAGVATQRATGVGTPPAAGARTQSATAVSAADRELLQRYCVTCHNDRAKTGGLSLAAADVDHPAVDGEVWEKVVRKLRAGLMPPAGAPRPPRAELEGFRRSIETALDRGAAEKLNPGATALHRLNRAEYANAVRDLLAIDIDASTLLPADDSVEGFDNIADVLGTSPALLERYIGAAAKISRLAVGNTELRPLSTTYKVRGDLSQDRHIEGLPLGTRGGVVIRHNFPVDGEYLFRFSLLKVNFGPQYGGAAKDEQIEMTVNGERVLLRDLPSVNYYYIRGGGAGRGGGGGARGGGAGRGDAAGGRGGDAGAGRGGAAGGRGGDPGAGRGGNAAAAPSGAAAAGQGGTATAGNAAAAGQMGAATAAGAAAAGNGAAAGRGGAPANAAGGGAAANAAAAPLEIRLPMKAGPQTIGVAFIKRSAAYVDDLVQRFDSTTGDLQTGVQYGYTTVPHLSGVEILGPYDIAGPGNTPSRARIFTCRPSAPAEEPACARRILSTLARRALRRPVTDRDMAPIMAFYTEGRQNGSFDRGIEMGLRRLLADPGFVFRFERDPANAAVGVPYRISDLELASRLSFFLWSSIPDEELLRAAEQGALRDPAMLQRQVRRMLADGRSQALITNFAGQWLFLRELRNRNPDLLVYPDFDDNLRQAFQRETELFFGSIVREDRSVFDLMNADYTFVNERLARHYGIPHVYGSDFRRVAVQSEVRRGLLGHGSILTVTSAPNRTSPVTRGAWILENLLGSPPPLPPPDVPALPETQNGQGITQQPATVREKMTQHRANPPCRGCHQIMDPIGLALENFDGVGRWRTTDAGFAIDAAGQLVDGTTVDGASSLRAALLAYPDAFTQTLTEKLLMYAVGRTAHHTDMPFVRAIARDAAGNGYRFSSLVLGIVNSPPFQMRITKAAETP